MHEVRKTIDQAGVNDWGDLSGDHNRLHCDPEYAAGTRYEGTILHGHFTVAWLMECALDRWGAEWMSRGELADVRFRAPLRPGVEYVVRSEPGQGDGEAALSVVLPDGTAGVTATARLRGAA